VTQERAGDGRKGHGMRRWRSAAALFWRSEPAPALALYLLLAAAEVAYVRLAGPAIGPGASVLVRLGGAVRDDSVGGLFAYAFFTWRMWLGGALSWTLSLAWKLLTAFTAVVAWHETGGPFLAGLVALTVASAIPLFAAAVLDRVDNPAGTGRLRAALPG
jgi:hypothetical protein